MKIKLTKSGLAVGLLAALTIPWQLGGKEPTAVLASLLLVVLAAFLLLRSEHLTPSRLTAKLWLPVALVGWAGLSLIWSVNRYQTVLWIEVMALAVMVFLLAHSLAQNVKLREQWLSGYLIIATATSLWGGAIYLTGSYERLTSSFYLANPFAAYILPAIVIALWRFSKTRSWLYGAVAVVLFAALVLADSRSALITLALAVVVGGAGVRLQLPQWLRLVGVLVVGFALVLGANAARAHLFHHATVTQGSRFSEAVKGESTSGSDRLNYLMSTLAIWRDHPVFGTGAGTFATMHPQYQYRVISAATNAHNFYAQSLSEIGIVGAGVMAVILIALGSVIIKCFRSKHQRLLALALGMALLHLALDIDAVYPTIMVVVAALAGFVVPPQLQTKAWRPQVATVALVGALVLLLPGYYLYRSQRLASAAAASQANGDFLTAAEDYHDAHSGLAFDPDAVSAEGINYYTMAGLESDKVKALAEYAQAKNLALIAQKLDPYDSQHRFLLARVLLKQNQLNQAETVYQQTIQLDRYNHPEYYADLADLYIMTNQPDKVVATATAALDQYPSTVVANRYLAEGLNTSLSVLYYFRAVAEQAKEPLQAKRDAQAALKLDSTNVPAAQLLGQSGS